jgi:hypothetical protein
MAHLLSRHGNCAGHRRAPRGPKDRSATGRSAAGAYDGNVLAINGFLEWFFLGLLTLLVVAVTIFGVFMAVQFFRNPGRPRKARR